MARSLPVSEDVRLRNGLKSKAERRIVQFNDVLRRLLRRQQISDIPRIFDEDEWEKVEDAFGKQKELDAQRLRELL